MTLSRMMLVGCLSLVGSALAGCGLGAADRLGQGSDSVVVSPPDGDGDGDGCTLTQGYWKNHEESWPTSKLTIGGVEYAQEELLELFRTAPKGDTSLILCHQLIAARLNVASGASDAALDGALADAEAWMAANKDADGKLPYGTKRGSAADEAVSLSGRLAEFNEGGIGPGHCDDGPGSGSGDPGGSGSGDPGGGDDGCGGHDGGTGESGEGGSDSSGGDPDGGTGEGGSDGGSDPGGGDDGTGSTCSDPCSDGCSDGYTCVLGCCVFIAN
ncbi:hypothetical protein WMF04_44685 [Sorangium sp. So ce260]|uniref:hypothetical protein n=1 Tax=Sorangium sp. So ce260 TaxID=3133291 RepID=UPI003F60E9E8